MLHKVKGREYINNNIKTVKYKDVILGGKVYHPDKNGIIDLPKEVKNKYVSKLSADEVKAENKDNAKDKSLSEMTVKELKIIAEEKEIKNFDKMKKEELVKAIEK